jgi:hypothetical protein
MYYKHYIDELGMKESTYNPCLLYTGGRSRGFSLVGLQTDNTLILADDTFAINKHDTIKKVGFLSKDREKLTISNTLKFNSGNIIYKAYNNPSIPSTTALAISFIQER